MSKQELIEKLKSYAKYEDREDGHVEADEALIAYIGDAEIAEAYEAVPKWYA